MISIEPHFDSEKDRFRERRLSVLTRVSEILFERPIGSKSSAHGLG